MSKSGKSTCGECERKAFLCYFSHTRVNMNVREKDNRGTVAYFKRSYQDILPFSQIACSGVGNEIGIKMEVIGTIRSLERKRHLFCLKVIARKNDALQHFFMRIPTL